MFLVQDGDPEALCVKLASFLGDETLRHSLGRNAAEYALNYAWEKIAKQIVGVYEELMGE